MKISNGTWEIVKGANTVILIFAGICALMLPPYFVGKMDARLDCQIEKHNQSKVEGK